jgi:hypothetical protein
MRLSLEEHMGTNILTPEDRTHIELFEFEETESPSRASSSSSFATSHAKVDVIISTRRHPNLFF